MLNLRVIQALRHSQQTIGTQNADIISLRKENRLLCDQLDVTTISLESLAPEKDVATLAFEGGDQVSALGKEFAIVEELWIDPDIFDSPLNFIGHPDSRARFASKDSYTQGTVAAVCNMVPKQLHQHIFNKKVFKVSVRYT